MKASQAQELYRGSAEKIEEYAASNQQGTLDLTCPDFEGGILLSYAPERMLKNGKGRITAALFYGFDTAGFASNVYVYGTLPSGTVTGSGGNGRGEYSFSLALPEKKSALLRASPRSVSITENGNPRDLGEILPTFLDTLSKGDKKLREK